MENEIMDKKDIENKNTEINDENNNGAEQKKEDNYLIAGMCIGMCLGLAIGSSIKKKID
jgi:hypothetical protein